MGAVEDTFTKQEIQAGYVTSGRDVLARQQQIVQQALSANSAGGVPRRRIGGGGPSGTGKAASNPVFPVPEFDEPAKASNAHTPAPVGISRAASVGANFPTPAAATAQQHANILSAKPMTRSASTGTVKATAPPPQATRKEPAVPPPPPATAASVVAGVHSVSGGLSAPSRSSTLTPLTPLKRASKPSTAAKPAAPGALNMPSIGSNSSFPKPQKATVQQRKNKGGAAARVAAAVTAPVSPPSPVGIANTGSNSSNGALASLNGAEQQKPSSLSSLGGDVIGPPGGRAPAAAVGAIGGSFGGPPRGGHAPVGSGALNSISGNGDILGGRPIGLSGLGGEVFTGSLSGGGASAIGRGSDKWASNNNTNQFSGSGALNAGPGQPIGPQGGLWGGSGGGSNLQGVGGPGGGVSGMEIGGGIIGGSQMGGGGVFGVGQSNGSSALANLLGINLPTGSGSLRETSNFWPAGQQPQQPAPVSSLHGAPMPMPSQGVIGRGGIGSSGLIGGVPIGGNPMGAIGGMHQQGPGAIGGSNKNDIALLQSLLPEVHITSSNGVAQGGWNPAGGQHQQQPVGVGAVGRNMPQQAQPQGAASGNMNIW